MNALLLVLCLAAAPAKHAYTVHDQVMLKRVLSFKVSPDGARVVYAQRSTDLEANRGRVDLYLVNADGTGGRQLTTHPENDSDPLWAPDGKSVFFLSTRGGSSQVWQVPVDGGEAVQVTKSPVDIETFVLSRDGAQLAFSADTFPSCDDLECTEKRLEEKAKVKASGKTYDSLFVRHWDAFGDGRRAHLFVQKVAGGPAVDVMKKLDADAPGKPFPDSAEYTFTPDGKALVFSSRNVGREEAWSTNFDLFLASVDGTKALVKLTTNPAWDAQPAFSPDGKTLAYLAMTRPGFENDRYRVVLRDWPNGKDRVLTEAWDRQPEGLVWAPDGKALLTHAEDFGQNAVFSLDVATGQATKLVSDGTVGEVAATATRLFFSRDSLTAPAEVFTAARDGSGQKAITQSNAAELAAIAFGQPEQFTFTGWNGDTVYGYIVKPVGFDPAKKYPVAFLVHGGPQGSFGNHFHYRWNPQTYAGHGYVALAIDFHGSTGYGQAFTDAIRDEWGSHPLEDLQKGLAAAQKKYPFIDAGRMCALGASYGGYMMNWMAGNWNEPWKCFVTHDGNLDERMAYFNTEELWFGEWEHKGLPWEAGSGYQKHNPVDFVSKWKVPTLVVHGGKDYRVVDTEGLSTFTALQRRGIPSKLLYFPDENHWVLKPANSVQWHETVNAWLDQWTKSGK